jgi:hypothetical protein
LGSYYIPLVVNYGLLTPFLTILEEPRPGTGLTLHPVITSNKILKAFKIVVNCFFVLHFVDATKQLSLEEQQICLIWLL